MHRPLFWSSIFFICGISGGYYFDNYPLFVSLAFLFMLSIVFLLIDRHILIIMIVIITLSGFGLMLKKEYEYNSRYSVNNWNEKGVSRVRGEIIEDLSAITDRNIYLRPEKINAQVVKYGLIQLNKDYLPANFKNGQLLTINLRLKTPEPAKNPGNFSYRSYLKKKGIYSIGYYEKSTGENYYIHCCRCHICKDMLLKLKKRLIYLVDVSVKKPLNEVIKALVLGERQNLPSLWKDNFAKAGASHLLAISGLHVGFIIIIFMFIVQSLYFPVVIRNILCTVFMLIYIFITGMRASVFRAGLLSLFFIWAPFWQRKGDLFNICGLTMLINLLINPYLLFTAGFQLTYLVLFMIIFWTDIIANNINKIIAVSTAAQLGSIPITAYYFNLITPVGILTNIWAIPLAAVIVVIAIIGLLLGLINPIFSMVSGTLLNYLLLFMKKGIYLMTLVPCGHIQLATPPFLLVIVFYIFLFSLPLIIKRNKIPVEKAKKELGIFIVVIITVIALMVYMFIPLFNNNLQLVFFSVGQGDSIFLKTPAGKYILVDGGKKGSEKFVLPYLQSEGIKKIDVIFITHFDADHAGGIPAILREKQVDLLILPEKIPQGSKNELVGLIIKLAERKNIQLKYVNCGDYLKYGCLYLKVLNPVISAPFTDNNNNSIVIKLKFRDFTALLTGDLEYQGELLLLNNSVDLKSHILKIGHHGSNSSSSLVFLNKISPLIAVISVGKNNYGHPAPEVIRRLNKMGIKIYRTDKDGAITVSTDGKIYKIKSYIN